MIRQTYQFEILTPCFCGGAEPLQRPEIRAASIRGQLRWWFRVLGGFKSLLLQADACRQEKQIFGAAAGESGHAGQLTIRVTDCSAPSAEPMSANDLGYNDNYLLFPLRETKSSQPRRGVFGDFDDRTKRFGDFRLEVLWRGNPALAPFIEALMTVFANLGALGFRSRRATGALTLTHHIMSLSEALDCFQSKSNIEVRVMSAIDAASAIGSLAAWLRSWRAHGRSVDHRTARPPDPPHNIGFTPFAENDHDRGADRLAGRSQAEYVTYRPAIGLPIIQRFSKAGTVNWEYGAGKDKGRFASPVLLRPHRDAQGGWHALVIFVDAHQWPAGKEVFLNGQRRDVSLDLYTAMKTDQRLTPFLN